MKDNRLLDLFPDEETFQKIYYECLEKEPLPTDEITPSDRDLTVMFEQYLSAIQEQTFRYAYECGYIAGEKAEA